MWFLVTEPALQGNRFYETDIPVGLEKWVQVEDGVIRQVAATVNEEKGDFAEGEAMLEHAVLEQGTDAELSTQAGDNESLMGDRAGHSLDDEIYAREDIDLQDVDTSDKRLMRNIQRQTLLTLRNDQDVFRYSQRLASQEDEERMANLTDLEHTQEDNADTIDLK